MAGNIDTIKIVGALPSEVKIGRGLNGAYVTNDLVITINGATDKLTVTNYFYSNEYKIEKIEFDDGTILDGAALVALAESTPLLPTGTTLYSTTGNDLVDLRNAANTTVQGPSGSSASPGNDTYIFGAGAGQDTIVDYNTVAGNIDTIKIVGALPSEVRMVRSGNNLILSIVGMSDTLTLSNHFLSMAYGIEKLEFADGTVYGLSDIQLGSTNPETLNGAEADSLLFGDAGNDILNGYGGNDLLNGGQGADTLTGGLGDDVYVVDNVADVVTENAGEGTDTVQTTVTRTLEANVENLTLIGTAAIDGTGNTLANVLTGNSEANVLDGGLGADTLSGWGGNDTYVVDNVGDIVTETSTLSTELDTVQSSITYTLGANVENLTLTGAAAINGTGNALANVITGNSADNFLMGDAGNDVLTGGAGNDTLDGGAGADTLIGGIGDDDYVIDNVGDVVTENVGEGVADTVELYLDANYSLGAGIEDAYRYGSGNWTTTGNAADNSLYGNSGNDTLIGLAGNDVLWGDLGADTLIGGAGDDRYYVDNVGDVVTENAGEGVDTVYVFGTISYTLAANVENAYSPFWAGNLTGNVLDNTLSGSYGADILDGGLGADTLSGWGGNDIYIVDNVGDVVNETSTLATEIDSVQSSINYTLGANVENLTLTGAADLEGTGNALANVLRGNSGYNVLWGLDGNDTLYAGNGDEAYGGTGNDTLYAENTSGNYTDLYGEDGDDTLTGGAGMNTLMGGLGNDTIIGGSGTNFIYGDDWLGAGGNDVIFGGTGYNYVWAGAGNDTVVGNIGNDNLMGQQGDDQLYGNAGNDSLIGGQGVDTLVGGTGDDTYSVDNIADIVTENAGEGTDTVQTTISRTLEANVENLTLLGTTLINGTGNSLNNTLTGNSASNILIGGAGDDILKGAATNTPASTTLGSLVIYARGTPVLDVYPTMQVYVDGVLIQEFTVDAASYTGYTVDPAKLGMAAGKVDVVFTNDAYRPDIGQDRNLYVQKIEVNGQAMNATDNGVFYDPGSGAAAFDGLNLRLGQETLASSGSIRFTLGDNDTLDGGVGADQMSGGNDNDTYMVDNVGDVVTEMPNEGMDTVRSSISHTLGANLENLVLTGTATINGTGNGLNNLLVGNAGSNILYGDAGVDTLIGDAGNDRLDGGAGNDILQGGQGNDTYVVESTGDSVGENANQGWDTVESSISYTLGANVENLTLTGTAALTGIGNELDNNLMGNSANNVLTGGAGNDYLDGGAGADTMIGGTGDDYYVIDNGGDIVTENAGEGGADSVDLYLNADYTLGAEIEYLYRYGSGNWTTTGNAADNYLYGNGGNDTLIGLGGNDLLWGDVGADMLIGGTGDDSYYVNTVGDVVTENANEGVDTIYVFGSTAYTLAANVENGSRTFWAGNLTGNALDNSLNGSWGVDTLDGGAGADTLTGFAGADTLIGGTGNDTYRIGRGYEADTIIESDATAGNTDIAQFLAGVSADQIWFQQAGNNLEASIVGTTDKLVIKDWYLGSANHVEQFKTTDGAKTLLDSNVQNLVNAMASFAPPAAGQTTLPQNYQDALAGVIAANWQ